MMYKLPVILWYSNSENREVHVTFTIRYLTFYLKQILILIKLVALPFSKLDHRHLTYFSHVRCLWMVQTKGPCTSLLTARAKVNCYMIWTEYITGFDFWCCMTDCKSNCFGNCSNEKCVSVATRRFIECVSYYWVYTCISLNQII